MYHCLARSTSYEFERIKMTYILTIKLVFAFLNTRPIFTATKTMKMKGDTLCRHQYCTTNSSRLKLGITSNEKEQSEWKLFASNRITKAARTPERRTDRERKKDGKRRRQMFKECLEFII